jgi:hypothetical protein
MLKIWIIPAFAAGALLATVTALGQTVAAPVYSVWSVLPPMGLASSETVQVNIVNNAPLMPGAATPSCAGSVAFYNESGSIIGTATTFTVGSGQIFSVTLPFGSAGASGSRTVIRAQITPAVVTWAGLEPPPSCILASSLETYDTATGATHAFAAGVAAPGIPVLKAVITAQQVPGASTER